MDYQNKTITWHMLEGFCDRIQDTTLKVAMRNELIDRAEREWGDCPAKKGQRTEKKLELTPEERHLAERMECSAQYGVFIKAKDAEQVDKDFINNMREFVESGGTYDEIPENIKCNFIKEAYDKEVKRQNNELEGMLETLRKED